MLNRKKLFSKYFNSTNILYKFNNFPLLDSKSVKPIQQILTQEKNLIIKAI